MGIQFTKSSMSTVSIKNRYNHAVNNPDATYGNDLDRIIPGLTQSFSKLLDKRGLVLNNNKIEKFSIPNWTVASDGKYYKYNVEINGDYYCPGNIVIDGDSIKKIENPEKQILIDYFILDLENKKLKTYNPRIKDAFSDAFDNIEKIEIRRNKEKGIREITVEKKDQKEPIIIEIDQNNQIIGYENIQLTNVGNCFLAYNKALMSLKTPNLIKTGNYCLVSNNSLTELELSNLIEVGNEFLLTGGKLRKIIVPNLRKVGDFFLTQNMDLTIIDLPQLEEYGNLFLGFNQSLIELNAPKAPKLEKYLEKKIRSNKEKNKLADKEESNVEHKIEINSKDIAQIDRENELTTTEENFARRIFNRMRSIFRREDINNNGR